MDRSLQVGPVLQGAAIHLAGYLLLAAAGTAIANSGRSPNFSPFQPLFLLVMLASPFLAGAWAAWSSAGFRVWHGVLAGVVSSLAIVLLVRFAFHAPIGGTMLWSLPTVSVLLAWLGAIVGAYAASRRGR